MRLLQLLRRIVPRMLGWFVLAVATAVVAVYVEAALKGEPAPRSALDRFTSEEVPLWLGVLLAFATALVTAFIVEVVADKRRERALATAAAARDELQTRLAETRLTLREVARSNSELQERLDSHDLYQRSVRDILERLQEILANSPGQAECSRIVEKEILEPFCSVCTERKGAPVRAAILAVSPAEPFVYKITEHAGWGLGAAEFRWDQARPIEQIGFERAESALTSPVRTSGATTAMLVALSSAPLNDEDGAYLEFVGAAISVVRGVATT